MNVISRDRWQNISPNARRASLQNLEYREADSQGRFPAGVNTSDSMRPEEYGAYDPSANQININSALLAESSPAQALGTYFHEERHAQQHNAARFPELSDNPEQAQEWRDNFKNYISPNEDFEGYYKQPVEADARDYSSKRLSEFQEQDNSQGRFTHEPSFAESQGRNLWQYGSENARLKHLQDTENFNAGVHNRPPLTIEARDIPDRLSEFDQKNNIIAVNQGTLKLDSPDTAYDAYKNGLSKASEHEESQHPSSDYKPESKPSQEESCNQQRSDSHGEGYSL